jgi:dihydropteroate synthase
MNIPHTINARGTLLSLHQPLVMGIINLTTDSFYAGSRIEHADALLTKAASMLEEGADILDLGAMSSRPGATISQPEDEVATIVPAIKLLTKHFPKAILSIDTLHSTVASAALEAGAHMINDISAASYDPNMFRVVSQDAIPLIMMHMLGLPSDMQLKPSYTDVTYEILVYFTNRIQAGKDAGVRDLIIDPGFGFGKTLQDNYTILKQLEAFHIFDLPVLAGISRKSMIWKPLHTTAEHALNGTSALHMVALQKGANILRVHDVKEAKEVITLFLQMNA